MRKNRIFALCFRLASFVLCFLGILATMGVFAGRTSWSILLYYTTESNILVLVMFGVLIVRTAADLKNNGAAGGASYYERVSAIVALSITVTLVVFWGLLAPYIGGGWGLFSFTNLQVHAITPLLMVFDYLFFAEPGKLKKYDPWIFACIPLAYFAQSTVLGFSGVRYGAQFGSSARFPYFFVDFDLLGARVFAYVLAITVFFMGLAYLLLWYDRRRKDRSAANGKAS
jgi:hypothetical protein